MSCGNKLSELNCGINMGDSGEDLERFIGIEDAHVSDGGTTGSLGTAFYLTQAREILRGY